MALNVSYPAEVQWAFSFFEIVAATHHTILFIFHIPHVIPIKYSSSTRRPSFVELLSVVVLLFIVIQQWWEGTMRWNPMPHISPLWCSWIKKCSACLYGTCKCLMYYLFLERLYAVFDFSAYQYKLWMKWTVRILGIIWLFVICTQLMLFADGEYDPISGICLLILPTYLAGAAVLSDIFFVMTISVAFCRRMLLLNMKRKNCESLRSPSPSISSESDAKLPKLRAMSEDSVSKECFTYNMVRKTLVLTLVGLLTTPGCIIIGALFGLMGFWVNVDFILSCWTIMLLFARHNWIYEHLCQRLEAMVTIRCLAIYSCYHCESYCCCFTHQLDDAIESPLPATPTTPTTPVASVEPDIAAIHSTSISTGVASDLAKIMRNDSGVESIEV